MKNLKNNSAIVKANLVREAKLQTTTTKAFVRELIKDAKQDYKNALNELRGMSGIEKFVQGTGKYTNDTNSLEFRANLKAIILEVNNLNKVKISTDFFIIQNFDKYFRKFTNIRGVDVPREKFNINDVFTMINTIVTEQTSK
jgi:hypothetical protein